MSNTHLSRIKIKPTTFFKKQLPKEQSLDLQVLEKALKQLHSFKGMDFSKTPQPVEENPKTLWRLEQLIKGREKSNNKKISAKKLIQTLDSKTSRIKSHFINRENTKPQYAHIIASMFGGSETVITTAACNREMLEVEKLIAALYNNEILRNISIAYHVDTTTEVNMFGLEISVAKSITYTVSGVLTNGDVCQLNFEFDGFSKKAPSPETHQEIGKAIAHLTPHSDVTSAICVEREIYETRKQLTF